MEGKKGSGRGFASMVDKAKQREIASKGGKAAHAKGKAHEWDSAEAQKAGRKGGIVVSRDSAHMAEIGRRGGEKLGKARERIARAIAEREANTAAPGELDIKGKAFSTDNMV